VNPQLAIYLTGFTLIVMIPQISGRSLSNVSGQACDSANRVGASVSDAAGRARQTLSEQGSRAADQGSAFVRDQPLLALALTGTICLVIGILLGRR
jgi:ElaB/YqjD/DUF883 family membrane-anchored ribosome-binding protein